MPTSILSDEAESDVTGITDYIAQRIVMAAFKMLAKNPGSGEGLGCLVSGLSPLVLMSCFFARTAIELMWREYSEQVVTSDRVT